MKQRGRDWNRNARNPRIERLEPRLLLDASALVISEFMASNDGTLLDAEGDDSDWIEIFNSGFEPVDLTGLHLTDDSGELDQWEFQAGTTLAPGGFLVVFASGKNTVLNSNEQHTNFRLSAASEYLALVDVNGVSIIDEFAPTFPLQQADVSYGPQMAASAIQTFHVTEGDFGRGLVPVNGSLGLSWTLPDFVATTWPLSGPTGYGYENNPGNSTNYVDEIATSVPAGTQSLYLRVPFTLSTLADLGSLTLRMKYDDGFVAYLNGQRFASSNAPDNLTYTAPAAGGQSDTLAEQFAEFDASAALQQLRVGQNVLAIHALNVPNSSDMLQVPELVSTASQLVTPVDRGYFIQPTPGFGNTGETVSGFAATPEIDLPHGFYSSAQTVALTTSTPNATLVYTVDGSSPAVAADLAIVNGLEYTTPITIDSTTTLRAATFFADFEPSPLAASTYLFVDDVIQQSPEGQLPGPGWGSDGLNGQQLNYGIDPEIISLYGAEAVKASLESLTTFSIVTDIENLFDANDGIYVNATNRGRDWERLASIELIDPLGTDGFQINAGLRIRGGFSRNDFNPKHAFRFYFRGEYGASKLVYPLFGDEGTDRFDVLDLRTAQNYAWSLAGDTQHTFAREVFGRDLQRDVGQPYTRSRYHHLYINGVYWGVFQTQERIEKFYGESYLGGDEEDYDVVKADLAVSGGTEVADGNDVAWRQLFDLAEDLADNPAANADHYWQLQGLNPDGTRNQNLPVLLDVDNLADYMLTIFYTGGYDSGLSRFLGDNRGNNWFGIHNRVTADQGFQFFIHDNEHSLGANDTDDIDRTGPFNNGNQSNYEQFNPAYLHQDLLASPAYRLAFADRVRRHFFDQGAMTRDASEARLVARAAEVAPAIIAESARWGDSKRSTPRDRSDWENEINSLLQGYFESRNALTLGQLRDDALYPDTSAPTFNQTSGPFTPGFLLQITASPGATIYYTLDGTDPRLAGGAINVGSAVAYSAPIGLTATATVQSRVLANDEWSAMTAGTFVLRLPGDYNADGAVDGNDLGIWAVEYGQHGSAAADGDQDGDVDGNDFLQWQRNFAASQPVAAVSVAEADAPETDSLTVDSLTGAASLTVSRAAQSLPIASAGSRPIDFILPGPFLSSLLASQTDVSSAMPAARLAAMPTDPPTTDNNAVRELAFSQVDVQDVLENLSHRKNAAAETAPTGQAVDALLVDGRFADSTLQTLAKELVQNRLEHWPG